MRVEATDLLHFVYGLIAGSMDSISLTITFLVYEVVEWLNRRDRVTWDLRVFMAGLFVGRLSLLFAK